MSSTPTGLAPVVEATPDSAPAADVSASLDTIREAEGLLAAELNPLPLVSVIIPTYNREKVILKALNSAFAQTYPNLEIIVVDDGSKDDTAAVLEPYRDRIRYIQQANGGASSARNRGIQEASGKYIAFLDSDDEWLPNKLEKQIALIEANPDLSIVACLGTDEPSVGAGYDDHATQFVRFLVQPFAQNMTRYVVRRDCFAKFGVFDTSIHGPEDWELWLRFLQGGCKFAYIPEPLMVYTVSDDSISRRPYAMLAGEDVIYQRYIATLPNTWQRIKLGAWFRARSYANAAISFREQQQLGKSLGYILRSLLICPAGPRTVRRLTVLLVLIRDLLRRIFDK